MSTIYPFKILNATTRTNDKFYVEFFGIKENISNVLGRQVYSVVLPDITFEPMQLSRGRNTYNEKGKINTGEMQIIFKDDDDSITDMILGAQLLRQLNNIHFSSEINEYRDYRFDVRIQKFSADGGESLGYEMKGCLLMGMSHGQLSYAQEEKGKITCNFSIESMNFIVPKKFSDVLDIDEVKGTLPSGR